ncbi:hypothetical protein BDW71DRAFT_215649 [Aspergillus fruticulosus]
MRKRTISTDQYNTHMPKELRRLYEPLGVLYELTMKGATKPRRIFPPRGQGISIMQRRRDFVDAVAFLGTYTKECGIAVALERQPGGLILRVAGTGDIDGKVVPFLNDLLHLLSAIVKLQKDEVEGEVKERILLSLADIALDFAQEKAFAHYMKLLHHIAPQKKCFKARQSGLINSLREFTYQGHEHVTYFEKFYKQIRKLSLAIDMTSQLLESAISLRQDLANDLAAESIPSSPGLPIPLLPRKLTMEGIAHRMFSDPSRSDDFLQKLQQTAPPGLTNTLAHYSHTVLTEVHPELLVINYFDSLSDGGFIDEGDKYIACTKPSCYLCHLFISYHPAGYSMISSNSRLCLNWRLPDISHQECNAMTRAKNQRSILQQLIDTIRIELERKVKNEWILQPHCTESETEWTLSIDDETLDYNLQPTSPELTPGYPIASTELLTSERDTSSDEMSGRGKGTDQDAEDVVVFKGRCRF